MKIRLTAPEDAADYVRYARRKTLEAIGEAPLPELLEPAPFGFYLLAYGDDENRPHGMVEFTFHDQVYGAPEETPYPESLGVYKIAPIGDYVGTRTIYVEPEARCRATSIYGRLLSIGSQLAYDLGARYSTVSTIVTNKFLMRLYEKSGGQLLGTMKDKAYAKAEIAVWVFDLEQTLLGPTSKRPRGDAEIDLDLVQDVRARNRWNCDDKLMQMLSKKD